MAELGTVRPINTEWARQLALMAYGDLPFESMIFSKVQFGTRELQLMDWDGRYSIALSKFYDGYNDEYTYIGYDEKHNHFIFSDGLARVQ